MTRASGIERDSVIIGTFFRDNAARGKRETRLSLPSRLMTG